MDPVLRESLDTLEFQDVSEIPKMKEIRQKWLKLSLLLHPDKSGGSKELFQKLISAYQVACDAAKAAEFDNEDQEEEVARKIYEQFQLASVIENLQCYTILLEPKFLSIWETVLGDNYGSPIDQNTNGKKFTFNDNCPESGTVFITLYHTSKLLIQAQNNHHLYNIHFVNSHLEDLYLQVYKRRSKISVHGLPVPSAILNKSPNIRVRSKSTSAGSIYTRTESDLPLSLPSASDTNTLSIDQSDELETPCDSVHQLIFQCCHCKKELIDQASLTIHSSDSQCDQSSFTGDNE